MTVRVTSSADNGRTTFALPDARPQTGVEVLDPVCGMEVAADGRDAEKTEYDGTTYYFCSQDCKATFDEEPEKFIEAI